MKFTLIVCLLAFMSLGLGPVCAKPAKRSPAQNLILISIDTLRPDHLGIYGYSRDTSPAIDRLRNESVLFSNSISHAPSTLPSHASMMTSLFPHQHRASKSNKTTLAASASPTLAEVLSRNGFSTASFNGGGQVSSEFGLNRGFETYNSRRPYDFTDIVDKSVGWLRGAARERFFLFLHTYEVHQPYRPKSELLELFDEGYSGALPEHVEVDLQREINQGVRKVTDEDRQHIVATYDAEIRSMDQGIAKLIDHLKETGQFDNTMIIFTSDHGEEFGERGRIGWHSHSLYEELLRVPLLIKRSKSEGAGGSVSRLARGIDLAPTAIAALGIDIPESYQGRDLFVEAKGEANSGAEFSISRRDYGWDEPVGENYAIRLGSWKLHQGGLFDLKNDPGEKVDLSAGHPDVVNRLRERLKKSLASVGSVEVVPVALEPDTEAQLRALGYVD